MKLSLLGVVSLVGAGLLMVSTPSAAQTPALKPALAPIAFLVGRWDSGAGAVADTGGRATGRSTISIEANGAVLLRRDHTDLFDASGKSTGGFDQIMMIYSDGGALHADYSDGDHLIHYTTATVTPGRSVSFTSTAPPGALAFKLTYDLTDPNLLTVTFGMTPPGDGFHAIATGTLHRVN